jgi:hypothetical protein
MGFNDLDSQGPFSGLAYLALKHLMKLLVRSLMRSLDMPENGQRNLEHLSSLRTVSMNG